jgi:FAD/FMN-containing dehydrogenase
MDIPGPGPRAFDPPPVANIRFATSVKLSDVSTSTVVDVSADPQIALGHASVTLQSDIAFASRQAVDGSQRTLRLDIQQPAAGEPHPLVIYVCGGGFWYAMKASGLGLRTFVAESGFVVASVEYRTVADGARWSDAVSDVKEAIRFLRSQASTYGIDPTRVGLWGESAGGYLAAMAALTNGMQRFDVGANLDQSSAVAGVVDKFGPSNLALVKADFDEESQRAFNAIGEVVAPILGHVGDGNFHVALMIDPEDPADLADAQELNAELVEWALARGGTCTGEHGIGLGKIAYLEREHGDLLPYLRALKDVFDPNGILNPGKILAEPV